MANLKEFEDFFRQCVQADRMHFEADSYYAFQDIYEHIGGWTGSSLMGLYNAATFRMKPDEQYLEVGTYCGGSLVAALYNNKVQAHVVDNFWEGDAVEDAWNRNVEHFGVKDRVTFHRSNAEVFDGELPPIGFYLYDGCHDSGHSYEGLRRYEKFLADEAIVIVDDYMIVGGHEQIPMPGHMLDVNTPVKTDVDRWLQENGDRFKLLGITPWGQQQAVMSYRRNA